VTVRLESCHRFHQECLVSGRSSVNATPPPYLRAVHPAGLIRALCTDRHRRPRLAPGRRAPRCCRERRRPARPAPRRLLRREGSGKHSRNTRWRAAVSSGTWWRQHRWTVTRFVEARGCTCQRAGTAMCFRSGRGQRRRGRTCRASSMTAAAGSLRRRWRSI
jgi:hypothetical protein